MGGSDIIEYPDIPDNQWQAIIDDLTLTLTEHDTPDKIVQAAEMIVTGMPLYKIAKRLNVSTKTVRSWLTKYPYMALAVSQARKDMTRWRMSQIEQQFFDAAQVSAEVLTANAQTSEDDDTPVINAKLLGIKAQHARYILSLFFGSKLDVNIQISEESPTLKASQSALDYITEKLKSQGESDEPIEATVRVIDSNEGHGPLLDSEGKPHHGELNKLDINREGVLCHVCGQRFERLDIHMRVKEGLSTELYETIFVLAPGSILQANKDYEALKNEQVRD